MGTQRSSEAGPFTSKYESLVLGDPALAGLCEHGRGEVAARALAEAAARCPDGTAEDAVARALLEATRAALAAYVLQAHGGLMLRFLRRIGCPSDQCESVLVDAVAALALRADQYTPGKAKFETWLLGITRNTWRNAHRGDRRWCRKNPLTESGVLDGAAQGSPLDEQIEARELLGWLLSQLVPALREAWVLAELEGLTLREIAAVCEVPEGTAARRVQRAWQRLRVLAAGEGARPALLPLIVGVEGIDGALRRLIDAERGSPAPLTSELAERVMQRVRERVRAPSPAPRASTPPRPPPRAGARSWLERCALVALGAGASWGALRQPPPRPVERVVVREVIREVALPAAAPVERAEPALLEGPATRAPPPLRRAGPRSAAGPRPVSEHEILLIEQAQAALDAHDERNARLALDRHSREFAHGAMAAERAELLRRIDRGAGVSRSLARAEVGGVDR